MLLLTQFISQLIISLNIKSHEDLVKILKSYPYCLRISEEDEFYNIFYTKSTLKNLDINENPWIKDCIGAIFRKNSNEIVAYTQSLAEEIIYNSPESVQNLNLNYNNTFISHYCEGTRFCVWNKNYNKNEAPVWVVSTSKIIDAYKCKWLSTERSYGELFWETAKLHNLNVNSLNPTCCYTFILCHPENNRIIKYDKAYLMYISSYDLTQSFHNYLKLNEEYTGMYQESSKCSYLYNIVNTMETYCNTENNTVPGIIVWDTDTNKKYKILNKKYIILKMLLNNINSIDFTLNYLNIRQNQKQIKSIILLNPGLEDKFKEIENLIKRVCLELLNLYQNRFINHNFNNIDRPYHVFIRSVHNIYLQNRKNKINLKIITKEFNKLENSRILQLLNLYQKNKNEIIEIMIKINEKLY